MCRKAHLDAEGACSVKAAILIVERGGSLPFEALNTLAQANLAITQYCCSREAGGSIHFVPAI